MLFFPADFFQNQLFRKILSGIQSECQTVCIARRLRAKIVLFRIQA